MSHLRRTGTLLKPSDRLIRRLKLDRGGRSILRECGRARTLAEVQRAHAAEHRRRRLRGGLAGETRSEGGRDVGWLDGRGTETLDQVSGVVASERGERPRVRERLGRKLGEGNCDTL